MREGIRIRISVQELNFIVKWLFIVFLFFPPMILSVNPSYDSMNKAIKILAAVFSICQIVICIFKKRNVQKPILFLMLLMFGWLETSNFLNGYDFSHTEYFIVNAISILGFASIIINCKDDGTIDILIKTIIIYCLTVSDLNIIGQFRYPQKGLYYNPSIGWQPFYLLGNANAFGLFYLFTLAMVYFYAERHKNSPLLLMGFFHNFLMIISLIMGNTSTGTICILACLILNLSLCGPLTDIVSRNAVLIFGIAIGITVWFIVFRGWRSDFIINFVDQVVHEKRNLITRGEIWDYALRVIKKNMIFGKGAVVTKLSYSYTAGISKSAHNTLLQITLFGGVVALASYLMIMFVSLVRCVKAKIYGYKRYIIVFFLYLVFFTFEQNPFYIGFFVLIAFMSNINENPVYSPSLLRGRREGLSWVELKN